MNLELELELDLVDEVKPSSGLSADRLTALYFGATLGFGESDASELESVGNVEG